MMPRTYVLAAMAPAHRQITARPGMEVRLRLRRARRRAGAGDDAAHVPAGRRGPGALPAAGWPREPVPDIRVAGRARRGRARARRAARAAPGRAEEVRPSLPAGAWSCPHVHRGLCSSAARPCVCVLEERLVGRWCTTGGRMFETSPARAMQRMVFPAPRDAPVRSRCAIGLQDRLATQGWNA